MAIAEHLEIDQPVRIIAVGKAVERGALRAEPADWKLLASPVYKTVLVLFTTIYTKNCFFIFRRFQLKQRGSPPQILDILSAFWLTGAVGGPRARYESAEPYSRVLTTTGMGTAWPKMRTCCEIQA